MSELNIALVAAATIVVLALRVRTRLVIGRRPATARAHAPRSRWMRPRWRRRVRAPTDDDVATWCDDISRRLRAGDALSIAVRHADAAPSLRRALAPLLLAIERGRPLDHAIDRLAAPASPVALALAVVRACAALGGPAAQPVDRAAATLRARAADAAERRAHSAQATMSATVLTVLPVVALVLMAAAMPSVRDVLGTAVGVACVVGGGVSSLAGWRWMRRIIEGAP